MGKKKPTKTMQFHSFSTELRLRHLWPMEPFGNFMKPQAPLTRKFCTDPLLSVCGGVYCSKHLPEKSGF